MAHHLTRRFFVPLVLLAFLFALSVMPAAAQEIKEIGLVVLYSDGRVYTEIVTVPVDATTFDVLRASRLELVYSETSFGPAICKIGVDGCPADDCFCSSSSWGYWHLEGNAWKPSDVGVGGFTPEDEAVEGFAWTAYNASFQPVTQPPIVTFAEIAAGTAPTQLPVTGGSAEARRDPMLFAAMGIAALAVGVWMRCRPRRVV